jgi:ketosteroid isomerase-like protein
MSAEDNVQVARDAYAAFARGDVAGAMLCVADDVEWVFYPMISGLPGAGTFRSKQAVQEWFDTLRRGIEYSRLEPYEFISEGDKVVVLIRLEATLRHNGRGFTEEVTHVLTVRDGAITRFKAFTDMGGHAAFCRGC